MFINPQIYRDIELVLSFYTNKDWSNSIPKVWRFTLYPLVISYILEMLSASADAYEIKEKRLENIGIVVSSLRKVKTISRVFCETKVISVGQMNHLNELFEKIFTQAKKWRNSLNAKNDKNE